MRTLHKLLQIGVIINVIFYSNYVFSQNQNNSVKIDALIKLAKYVDWYPAETKQERILIIFSDDNSPINYEVPSKNNFNYNKWQVICTDNYKDIKDHSMVFITEEKQNEQKKLLKISKEKNLLLVGDNIDNFCQTGGQINLICINESVNFEINYSEIKDRNIEISSKLLTLSKIL